MTDNKYFLNGVLIIAFLFVVSYFLVGWNGRYEFGGSTGTGVWKIDTVTGQVWRCPVRISEGDSCRPLRTTPPTTD